MQTWAVDTRAHLLEAALLPGRVPETSCFFHLGNIYQVLLCARFCQSSLTGKGETHRASWNQDLVPDFRSSQSLDTQGTLGSKGVLSSVG